MDEELKPQSRRWKRWALLVLCLLIATGLIVPPILSNRAEKRIRQRIEKYQAAGEPVTVGDLATPPVPDAENAVVELRQAAGIVSAYAKGSSLWAAQPNNHREPLSAEQLKDVRKIVADNRNAIPPVDVAMKKKRFFWPSQPTSPALTWLLPDLSPQRELMQFLMMCALSHADSRDYTAAAADLLRGQFAARALSHHPQALVVSLVVEAMRSMASDTIIAIAPRMKIGNGPGEARPDQVRQIIAQLLDDAMARDYFRRGYFAERVLNLDTADAVLSGRMSASVIAGGNGAFGALYSPAGRYFTSSYMLEDVAIILDVETTVAGTMDLADWPAAKARLAHLYAPAYTSIKHAWAQMLMPNLDRSVQTYFRGQVQRHLAAATLAARWYACEHEGKYPPTLEALVPKYLPAVPTDRMAAGAPALRYINDPNDPRVYSVGDNGVDDHGAEKPLAAGQDPLWGAPDAVVHLKRK